MVTSRGVRIVEPFPAPPRLVGKAYAKLQVLQTGTDEQIAALGPLELLERPWEPTRCGPATRRQLWDWLDDVAAWVNHEFGWGVDRLIPPCWPQHPHIAHELAVLADQRYTAGQAFHGGALEEWHRFSLPLFLERMTSRLGTGASPDTRSGPPRPGTAPSPCRKPPRNGPPASTTTPPPRHVTSPWWTWTPRKSSTQQGNRDTSRWASRERLRHPAESSPARRPGDPGGPGTDAAASRRSRQHARADRRSGPPGRRWMVR
ncbi:MAG: hypothetical protein ABJA74_01615 [Lapillicoccus sp.]